MPGSAKGLRGLPELLSGRAALAQQLLAPGPLGGPRGGQKTFMLPIVAAQLLHPMHMYVSLPCFYLAHKGLDDWII